MLMNDKKPLAIGSDHAGFELKEFVKTLLATLGVPCTDLGAHTADPGDDYPVFAARVASAVSHGEYARGIVVCGTGIGASITANRFRGVRAALCVTPQMARLSREHNNANVLALGGYSTPIDTAAEIVRAWLDTPFGGGRHIRRTELIETLSDTKGAGR